MKLPLFYSWRTLNAVIWVAVFFVLVSAPLIYYGIKGWIAGQIEESPLATGGAIPKWTVKSKNQASLSLEAIERAGKVQLRRMNPPVPIPEPPPAPVQEPTPVPASPPIQFDGQLIGTIVDPEPKYRYAIIKWKDNRILHVGLDQPLQGSNPSLVVSDIQVDSITLTANDQTLVIKMPEPE